MNGDDRSHDNDDDNSSYDDDHRCNDYTYCHHVRIPHETYIHINIYYFKKSKLSLLLLLYNYYLHTYLPWE